MGKADSELSLVHSGQMKRTALEEPIIPPDAKRIKSLHHALTQEDGHVPAPVRRVPFPDKAC
jgi:hypothetical protein